MQGTDVLTLVLGDWIAPPSPAEDRSLGLWVEAGESVAGKKLYSESFEGF